MSQPNLRKGATEKLALALVAVLAAYIVWVAVWSRQGAELAPVKLGVDSCHHCGMVVSELRHSVSVLVRDEQDHLVTRHFDDPGCFKKFIKDEEEEVLVGVAHDYESGREIPLANAVFVKRGVETPMGSGLVATFKEDLQQ